MSMIAPRTTRRSVAFIDDGLVVPGTGGTVGGPGNDYGPPGGYIVNNTGGLLGPTYHIENSVYSPVMTWPDPALGGMTFAFDVYRHELLIANDTPGHLLRAGACARPLVATSTSEAHGDRNFVYYGGPDYLRSVNVVGRPGRARRHISCQVRLGVYELGWQFGYGNGTNGTPAPYFDNVSVKVYPIGRSPDRRDGDRAWRTTASRPSATSTLSTWAPTRSASTWPRTSRPGRTCGTTPATRSGST